MAAETSPTPAAAEHEAFFLLPLALATGIAVGAVAVLVWPSSKPVAARTPHPVAARTVVPAAAPADATTFAARTPR